MSPRADKIWFDGKLVDWDEAQVHVLAHTLHYGVGVFEGIRAYRTEDDRTAIFRLREHVDRLWHSARAIFLEIPSTPFEITAAIGETVRANGLDEAYIRPLVFLGSGAMGLHPGDNPVHVMIAAWTWGTYLGDEGLAKGIRTKISSYLRPHVNSTMTKAKVCGHYVNSYLAKQEARRLGYDEALFLDTEGYVCEGSGENAFIVRDGVLKTPPLTSALPGITRDSVVRIARDLGIPVEEGRFTRDELYMADEAFLTGTAAEVTPIREVDDIPLGAVAGVDPPGPITKSIQETYFRAVQGGEERYRDWLTYL